jgi:hypothetical protein
VFDLRIQGTVDRLGTDMTSLLLWRRCAQMFITVAFRAAYSSLGPPTPILPGFCLSGIAPLGLSSPVELATRIMVNT